MTFLVLALTPLGQPAASAQPVPAPRPVPVVVPSVPPVPGPFAQPVAPTPLWNQFARPPAWFPGPAAQPFGLLPRVCRVEPAPCHGGAGGGTDEVIVCPGWVKEFHQAAHFPVPRFDQTGAPMLGDGLLIYEGMRLVVDPATGIYEVSFTATVPNMPATLRLQLVFERCPDDPTPYRLTLPPVRLEPKPDARLGDPAAYTFHVAHRGYSSLFVRPVLVPAVPDGSAPVVPFPTVIDAGWILSRVGTARLGSVTATDDPTR
jgi:hypothetical protein